MFLCLKLFFEYLKTAHKLYMSGKLYVSLAYMRTYRVMTCNVEQMKGFHGGVEFELLTISRFFFVIYSIPSETTTSELNDRTDFYYFKEQNL